jgi:internalin A
MSITTIRIFLAASSELKSDREQFAIFIARENEAFVKKNIFLELVIWEDFIESMSRTRLQNEYNNAIVRSDIFIMLFGTSLGKYALEEFETATNNYKKSGRSYTYIFFKDAPIETSILEDENNLNLLSFKETLKVVGHFGRHYKNIDDLKYQFRIQLDNLIDYFVANSEEEKTEQKGSLVKKNAVFISYSHRDNEYLDRLMVHLKPLAKSGAIDLWVDTKLVAGEKW